MTYINTDSDADSEKYGVFTQFDGGKLNKAPYRYRANLIVDDIEADPDEAYEPPPLKWVGKPSINDLATWRWQKRTLDAESERKLIRRIQEGDARAFHELLAAHHHSIRPIVSDYTPKGWWSPRQEHKHTNHQLSEDLMAVGCFGLWKAALEFDFNAGCRFWTFAKHKIKGLIANEAHYQRRRGMGGGGRLDRRVFNNLGSPPEKLLETQKLGLKKPVFHSLQEAAEALRVANGLEHCEVFSSGGDDCDIERSWAHTGDRDGQAG